MGEPVLQAARAIIDGETREGVEERRRIVEALTPSLGAEDAEIAAALHQDIRLEPKRRIAKLGAEFLMSQLKAPSRARQMFKIERVEKP